ncbi:MAG TPA: carboxypeptidase-like regulatory domain-containing protein [Solirubrobacterales bacterium]|nr:carboxypeptidase-like regulatory domain-containing protein [Solirubrobacterales bacterium]
MRKSALLGLAVFVAMLAPTAAQAATVSGTVTGEDTHAGIGGVEVCTHRRSEGEGYGGCAFTDPDGHYEIEALAPAEYDVWFRANGTLYVPEPYPSFITVADSPVTGIDAELAIGGRIEGTIRAAATGMPVETSVCMAGLSPGSFGGCTGSDSEGRYVLTVAAGEYRVEFSPFEGRFLTQYYDHFDHWYMATPVTVAVGETRQGIDADLVVGGWIEGTVRLADETTPVAGAEVCARSTGIDGGDRCSTTAADGTYSVDRLRSGKYKVEFSPPAGSNLQTQYWHRRLGWNSADVVELAGEVKIVGVDAYLAAPPVPAKPRLRKCRKGFHRKLVKGKKRCVRKHRHHRRHRRSHR